MIFEKLHVYSNLNPLKVALKTPDETVNYDQLYALVLQKAKYLSRNTAEVFLLESPNALENTINALALMYIGKRSIILPKDYPLNLINQLKVEYAAVGIEDVKMDYATEVYNDPAHKIYKLSDVFLGVLTSGSTGVPKVIWKDFQAWFTAFPVQSTVFGITEADNIFVLDSLAYSANFNTVLHGLWQGCTIVLASQKKANKWTHIFDIQSITSIFMVPSHYKLIPKSYLSNAVKSIISAGEKLDKNTAQILMGIFPNANIIEYYGSAELGHISYQQNKDIIQNNHTVGRPFPGVEITLKNNQIFVKSPYVSPDYRTIGSNGDLGYWQNDLLILVGRASAMYNRKGLNIFANEIENAALEIQIINEAAVIGLLQKNNSHKIVLFYTCKHGFLFGKNRQIIAKNLKNLLPKEKLPNTLIELQIMPKTSSGKTDYMGLENCEN